MKRYEPFERYEPWINRAEGNFYSYRKADMLESPNGRYLDRTEAIDLAVGKYPVAIRYDAEEKVYFATAPDLPGCITHGDTPLEALAKAYEVMAEWMSVAKEKGWAVPEPGGRKP